MHLKVIEGGLFGIEALGQNPPLTTVLYSYMLISKRKKNEFDD
jgi:hypothetical protein